jgi:hypothetical protein
VPFTLLALSQVQVFLGYLGSEDLEVVNLAWFFQTLGDYDPPLSIVRNDNHLSHQTFLSKKKDFSLMDGDR